jgi:hypothetical protein
MFTRGKILGTILFALASASCTEQSAPVSATNAVTDLTGADSSAALACAAKDGGEKELAAKFTDERLFFIGESAKNLAGVLTPQAKAALATLPKLVLDYFDKQQGLIVVTSRADELCSGAVVVPNISGCFRTVPTSMVEQILADQKNVKPSVATDKLPTLLVLVKPEQRFLGHNLTRLFSHLVAEYFSELNPSQSFALGKRKLARAFIRDMWHSQFFNDSERAAIFGEKLLADLKPIMDKSGDLEKHPELFTRADWLALENKAFAESMHSYYCSVGTAYDSAYADKVVGEKIKNPNYASLADTRKFLEDFFPETSSVFASLAKPLEGKKEEAALALASKDDEDVCDLFPDAESCTKPGSTSPASGSSTGKDDELLSDVCSLYPWAAGCSDKDGKVAGTTPLPTDKDDLETFLGELLEKIGVPIGGSGPLGGGGAGPGPLGGGFPPIFPPIGGGGGGKCGGKLASSSAPIGWG